MTCLRHHSDSYTSAWHQHYPSLTLQEGDLWKTTAQCVRVLWEVFCYCYRQQQKEEKARRHESSQISPVDQPAPE